MMKKLCNKEIHSSFIARYETVVADIHSNFVAHYETVVGAVLSILLRFQEVKHMVFEVLMLLEDGKGSQMKF